MYSECIFLMERVLHGETQGGQTGRAWRIRLADMAGYCRGTKRRNFRSVAQTKANRSEATTVGSLLQCVHALQIKLPGRPRRQDLHWCASILIQPGWLRPESRECGVQLFCERSSDHIHHVHTHTQTLCITLGVRVASECCARATPLRHVYTGGSNIISLEERSRGSTVNFFWRNNKLARPLNYWLVRWERHERCDGCIKMQEYVS